MYNTAFNAGGREQRYAEDDVGKLADRRIGEPRLQVVLAQGDHRRCNNRERHKVGGGQPKVKGLHAFDTEHVEHDADGGEDADFDCNSNDLRSTALSQKKDKSKRRSQQLQIQPHFSTKGFWRAIYFLMGLSRSPRQVRCVVLLTLRKQWFVG